MEDPFKIKPYYAIILLKIQRLTKEHVKLVKAEPSLLVSGHLVLISMWHTLSRCCQNRKAASILFPASVCSCVVSLAPYKACKVIQGDPVHRQAWTLITLGLWFWSAWSRVPALRELVSLELELTAGSPRKSESVHRMDLDQVMCGWDGPPKGIQWNLTFNTRLNSSGWKIHELNLCQEETVIC